MKNYLPLIIGMMTVTYLPRLIPLLIMTKQPINPLLKRFLLYIPYTALGALIMHGMIEVPPNMRFATLFGIIAAAVCSWFKGSLVLSVLVAMITAFLILQL
jgi:branched-subunit amino acid transport protein